MVPEWRDGPQSGGRSADPFGPCLARGRLPLGALAVGAAGLGKWHSPRAAEARRMIEEYQGIQGVGEAATKLPVATRLASESLRAVAEIPTLTGTAAVPVTALQFGELLRNDWAASCQCTI